MSDAVFGTSSTAKADDNAATTQATEPEKTFDVSKEEISLIRADLASDFPEDYQSISEAYIESVASKPYSKEPSIRRPIDYSTKKLKDVLQWRADNAVQIKELFSLIPEGEATAADETGENSEQVAKAVALATSLNYGAMYWHGLDKEGRPVLWIRTDRMPWFPDTEALVRALIYTADTGVSCMPSGVTDFVVVSDSASPPPPNPQFMIGLLTALVKGFPDRLHELISCPVGKIIQTVMSVLIPLMPSRLASKIILIGEEETKAKLSQHLLNGEADIPTFLGGTADHDVYYPKEGTFSDRTLKFDYAGMTKRLEAAVKDFEQKHKKSEEIAEGDVKESGDAN